MSEVDRSYRILQLEPGASIREVIEARDDLLFLWDPSRLGDRPRLRSQAPHRQAEIQKAATLLLESLSAGNLRVEAERAGAPAHDPGPSLYVEMFAKTGPRRSWLPLVVIAGLVMVAVLAALLFLGGEEEPLPIEEASPAAGTGPAAAGAPQPETADTSNQVQSPPAGPLGPATTPQVAAPPPGEVAPNRSEQAAAKPPSAPAPTSQPRASGGNKPVLLRGAPPLPPRPEAAASPQTPPLQNEPAGTPAENQAIFDQLLEGSRAARMLAGGRFSDLPFNGWKVLEKKGDEFYLDLAVEKDGTTVHFIWGVNLEKKAVRPLSQAARDLEAGTGNQNPDED